MRRMIAFIAGLLGLSANRQTVTEIETPTIEPRGLPSLSDGSLPPGPCPFIGARRNQRQRRKMMRGWKR